MRPNRSSGISSAISGGNPSAMRAFQSYRELLRDEIGTDPSAALVELDRAELVRLARVQTTAHDVEPEELLPPGMPERAFAKGALAIDQKLGGLVHLASPLS